MKNFTTNLLLQNRFDKLSETVAETIVDNTSTSSSTQPQNTNNKPVSKKEKIPPIVVGSNYYTQLIEILNALNITVYGIKYTTIGIKINLSTSDDYKAVVNKLNIGDNGVKLNYFTYRSPDEKDLKFVLKGLPLVNELDIIKTALSKENILCDNIKIMKIKNPRYSNQCNYLLYFKKGSININDIRKVKKINNVEIFWQYYQHPQGPTQCRNCQLHGHGSQHCKLSPKCVKCGGPHLSHECNIDVNADNKKLLKCANCGSNHAANYSECPQRLQYIEIKGKLSNKNSKVSSKHNAGSTQQRKIAAEHFSIEKDIFPPLKTPRSNAEWTNKFQNTDPSTTNHKDTNDDMFSPQQLIYIFKELTANLKKCRSKYDQIEVVTELAMKYIVV